MSLFHIKSGSFSRAASALGPGLSLPQPCRSHGHEPCWSSKTGVLGGLFSQVSDLRAGVPVVGYKPLAPQGEASDFGFPPDSGLHCCG